MEHTLKQCPQLRTLPAPLRNILILALAALNETNANSHVVIIDGTRVHVRKWRHGRVVFTFDNRVTVTCREGAERVTVELPTGVVILFNPDGVHVCQTSSSDDGVMETKFSTGAVAGKNGVWVVVARGAAWFEYSTSNEFFQKIGVLQQVALPVLV